jgi:hypothetical protein
VLRLKPSNITPPDGFRFRVPGDGTLITANVRSDWLDKIAKHYRDNGYTLSDDWQAQAETQLCALLPPGWCRYDDGTEPRTFIDRRFNLGDAINGTNVLIEFVKQGAPLVNQDTAEARAKTCAACYALLDIPGCNTCASFANYVAEVAGARATKADPLLETKVCGVCHCSARANIWIPVEVSKAGVTDEMMEQFPDWCWKKQGIEALRKSSESVTSA